VRRLAAVALVATGLLVALHRDDVAAAIAAIPPGAFVAAVALHAGTPALRSEAWRVVLVAACASSSPGCSGS
jgi:hypothetical protein